MKLLIGELRAFQATEDLDMLDNCNIKNLESGHSVVGTTTAGSEALHVDELPVGTVLEVETGHTKYVLENCGEGMVLISGHPTYCPEPVLVQFHGSIGDSSLLKIWRIEPGLKMVFRHPDLGVVRTSRVREIRQLSAAAAPVEAHSFS